MTKSTYAHIIGTIWTICEKSLSNARNIICVSRHVVEFASELLIV